MRINNRLALGTAQFGLSYGVANQRGQVDHAEALNILSYAWSKGLDTIDTAVAYGNSEQNLGAIGIQSWKIVSKLPPIPIDVDNVDSWVEETLHGSLIRLKIDKLRAVLLHHPQDLLGKHGEVLYKALLTLKDQKKVEMIGISIYGPDELDFIVPKYSFDIVQAPFNIIDRRLATSGWLARLHEAGVEIHVRSVFLQGLLLMDPSSRPPEFNRWNYLWDLWDLWLEKQGLTPLQACLGFVLSWDEIERIVIGIDSLQQISKILEDVETSTLDVPATLACNDEELINPSRWGES